jgi:hypothetical protein
MVLKSTRLKLRANQNDQHQSKKERTENTGKEPFDKPWTS